MSLLNVNLNTKITERHTRSPTDDRSSFHLFVSADKCVIITGRVIASVTEWWIYVRIESAPSSRCPVLPSPYRNRKQCGVLSWLMRSIVIARRMSSKIVLDVIPITFSFLIYISRICFETASIQTTSRSITSQLCVRVTQSLSYFSGSQKQLAAATKGDRSPRSRNVVIYNKRFLVFGGNANFCYYLFGARSRVCSWNDFLCSNWPTHSI